MNPPWFEDSDSTDDEEWMDSIQKYDHLFDFRLDHPVKIIKVQDDNLLMVKQHNSKWEVAIYQIPAKLLSKNSEEEGLLKSRELNLKYGYYTSSCVIDAEFLPSEKVALLVQDGLEILETENDSDLLVKKHFVNLQHKPTRIKYNSSFGNIQICCANKLKIIGNDLELNFEIEIPDSTKDFIQTSANEFLIATESDVIQMNSRGETLNRFKFETTIKRCRVTQTFQISAITDHGKLFIGRIKDDTFKMKEVSEIEDCSDLKWIANEQCIMVTSNEKLHLVQFENEQAQNIFTHSASKKVKFISAFASHPTIPSVIFCAYDSKCLQIFQKSSKISK